MAPPQLRIEPLEPSHVEAVVGLALRAWEPVFASIEDTMGSDIFFEQHPDWRANQGDAVAYACTDPAFHAWVGIIGAEVAGFVAVRLFAEDRMGEIYMVAVDPPFQRRGIAAALTAHALDWMKAAGMTTAMVETGGDPGHAPARLTYEAAGFRLFPVARYFKKL